MSARADKARLNLVFLGCGAATAARSRTLRAFSSTVRCFYASRDPEKAMAFERRLSGAGSFGSYEGALADGRMDVAFVATPPDSHLPLVMAALGQGKDVIVEKPAFLKATDFELVAREAMRVRRRVLVAENYCYKPLACVLRQLLAEKAVGRTLFVQVNALKEQRAGGWRSLTAGGALVEGGVHWIDLLAHLGPSLRSVETQRAGDGLGPERSSLVLVRYEDGSLGTLLHSWEAPSVWRGLQLSRIRGTEGSIVFESNGLFVLVAGRVRRWIWPGLSDLGGYHAMFVDFLRALQGGPEPLMTLERARRDVEIALCAGEGHGLVDRGTRGRLGGSPHLDLGDVQGLPA